MSTIDRSQLFRLAWKRAKATAASYRPLRTAFAAALRSVWSLVKAAMAEEARRPVRTVEPVNSWVSENPYRAAAVAARKARLGTYCTNAW
ncbi:MAG: hypothetical protein H7Y60_12830 [Rhodospirillaceae bacterium]|nr:hypothetical protein [Rhodospirillales bacterium]